MSDKAKKDQARKLEKKGNKGMMQDDEDDG